MKKNKFMEWIKSPSSDFLFFIVLLILANIVAHNAFIRFDLTGPKSYSLSKSSKQLVKTLEEPLSVKVFFDDNLPSPYNSYAQYIKDLLEEYQGSANKNFSVSYMDMKKDENKKLAVDYGLRQIQIQEVKNNEVGFKQVYMSVVMTYGDAIEKLDAITSINGLEYKFTSTMTKMIDTVDALNGLGKGNKINVTLYLSDGLKTSRISGIDQVEKILRDSYNQVNKQNLGRLDFSVESPLAGDVNAIAEQYGLQIIQAQKSATEIEDLIFGAVVSYNDNFRVLPVRVERGFFGHSVAGLEEIETSMNECIQSLLAKTAQIGYVVGHYEHSLSNENDSANFYSIVSTRYDLEEVDLYAGDVPAGLNTVIVDGPQTDFSEEELYRLDQFLMKGGNVIFFVDPLYSQGGGQYQLPTYAPLDINIDRLLDAYGVKVEKNFVMDKACHQQSNQSYGQLNYYWVPVLQNKDLAKNHPITKNLGYVYMCQNGAVDASAARENKNVDVTVLAKSSPDSWTMKDNVMLNPIMINSPTNGNFQSYDLAVLIEGKFNSAFDEAPEMTLYDEEGNEVEIDTTNDEFKSSSHIASSRLPGKIFVAGSSQLTTAQLLDETPNSAIAYFLLNVLDYMNGAEELCTMRTKGLALNTLSVKSLALAQFLKYFNEFGLVALTIVAGLIVWRLRAKRRAEIRTRYNPNDDRETKKI